MTEKNTPNSNDCPGDQIRDLLSGFRRYGYVKGHDVRANFVVGWDGQIYQHVDDIKHCPDPAQHECGRGSCWKGEGHDGPCEPSGRPTHQEELRAAVERAEKAEQEAARLKDSRDTWSRYAKERSMTIKEQAALIDALLAEQPRTVEVTATTDDMVARIEEINCHDCVRDAAEPRPLTADDITELVEQSRFRVSDAIRALYPEEPMSGDRIIQAVIAALTPEPARPEGAEELDGYVDAFLRGVGLHPLSAEQIRILADNLAEEGVRAPEDER